MTGSGIDPETGKWAPAFPGQRPPVKGEPGNELAVKHGTWSKLKLEPRAAEFVAELRELVPARRASDEPTISLLALVYAQIEAATGHLAEHGLIDSKGNPHALLKHLGTMLNTAARLCGQLGLTPMSRAKLRLDVAIGTRVLTLTDLVEQAELEGEAVEDDEHDEQEADAS